MKIVKIRLTQVDQVREFVELTSNCNYDVDLIPENNEIRKGLGEIMGGKILKLRSEELLEQGRIDAIQNMIDLGLTKEQILKKYSLEEYEKALEKYKI